MPHSLTINVLAEARRVLQIETEALSLLSKSLDDSFIRTVRLLKSCTGKVIVTGMGKSGLIGKKIAATFSSTGTPAFFVHPGEASHGDLGMIRNTDVILALSNSGETKEIFDLIAYTRHHNIPLTSITQNAQSSLAKSSDTTITLPAIVEACPNGLAPTTSTTLMLAIGDALALCLLKEKNFSKEDYKQIHPGGSLGNRLKYVKDLMHTGESIPLVAHSAPMSEALIVMSEKGFGCIGVIQNSTLIGIVTDGDLRRHMSSNLLAQKVCDIMSAHPITISSHTLAEEALEKMAGKITALFVTDDESKPLGLVHIHDLIRLGLS